MPSTRLQRSASGRPRERLVALLVWSSAAVVSAAFAWIVADLLIGGLGRISAQFVLAPPLDAGRAGGIGPMIVSTAATILVCIVVAAPISLATAILLAEFTSSEKLFARLTRRSLDVLAGVPSIVFGLFGYAFFCQVLGMGFSLLAGGLTLACMTLPILIRSIEAGFRAVPDDYRLGAAALGISRTSTLMRLLLPAATPGLVVGLVLGIGRAIAETAALVFTSGYVDRMPRSLMDSGRTLSVHIFDLSMNVPGGTANAYATAVVLLVLLIAINTAASSIAQRWLGRRIVRV